MKYISDDGFYYYLVLFYCLLQYVYSVYILRKEEKRRERIKNLLGYNACIKLVWINMYIMHKNYNN